MDNMTDNSKIRVNVSTDVERITFNVDKSTSVYAEPSVVQYDTHFDFPNVGREGTIYIDKATNKAYRWDDSDMKYYVVGSDYNDITVINGGEI